MVRCYPSSSLAGMPRPAPLYFEKYLGILKDHKWSEPQLYSLSKRKIPLEAEKPHSGWAGLTVPPAEAPRLLRATASVPPRGQGRPRSTAIAVSLVLASARPAQFPTCKNLLLETKKNAPQCMKWNREVAHTECCGTVGWQQRFGFCDMRKIIAFGSQQSLCQQPGWLLHWDNTSCSFFFSVISELPAPAGVLFSCVPFTLVCGPTQKMVKLP